MRRRYLLFYLGVALLLGAVMASPAAFNYEFTLTSTSDEAPTQGSFAAYDDFDSREQRMIRQAINGRTFIFTDQQNLPAATGDTYVGELTIERGDTFYTFKRGSFFDITTLGGALTVALAIGGLLAVGAAIRLQVRAT